MSYVPQQQIQEGYKRTEIGVLPIDWNVESIKESYDICNTLRLPISAKIREGMQGTYPYYGPTRIQDYLNEYRIEGEYALIGEDGDHFLKYEYMPQTQLANGRFNVNNHAHLIKGKKNLTEWFYFFFRNRDISIYLTRQGAGRYKLSKGSLETLPCALPPVSEQKEIISVLSDVDALITSLEKLIAKKRAIKTSTMQQLLTGKKRLPPFDKTHTGYKQTELGEIPEDWEVVELGTIGQNIIGLTYSPNDVVEYGSLVLRSSNVQNNKLAFENNVFVDMDLPNRVIVKEGDILVCVRNGSKKLIGKCALIDKKTVGSAFGAFMSIYRTQFSDFIFYQFQSNIIQRQIDEIMGATINQITNKDMAVFMVPLPNNHEEQCAISKVLSDMDTEIDGLEQRHNKTQQLKQGMMQELLTGRTRLV